MEEYKIQKSTLDDIADAINAKTGESGQMTPLQMPGKIESITPAKEEQSKTLTLGAAAPSTVSPDSGKVLSSVPVSIDTSVIKAENIAKDVQILGVTGTHEGGGGGPLVVYGQIVAGSGDTQIEFTGSSAYSNYLITLQPNRAAFSQLPVEALAWSFSEIQGNKKICGTGYDQFMGNIGDAVLSKNGDVITLGGSMGEYLFEPPSADWIGVFW